MLSANHTVIAGELTKWIMRNPAKEYAVRALSLADPTGPLDGPQSEALTAVKGLAEEKFQWGIDTVTAIEAAKIACRGVPKGPPKWPGL